MRGGSLGANERLQQTKTANGTNVRPRAGNIQSRNDQRADLFHCRLRAGRQQKPPADLLGYRVVKTKAHPRPVEPYADYSAVLPVGIFYV
jgi:hypothetical protein